MAGRLSLAILVVLLIANRSEAAPLCTLTVGSVPVNSPLSTSGAIGDLNVACADLASTPTTVTLSYFFNTAVVASGTPTLVTDMGLTYNGAFGPQIIFRKRRASASLLRQPRFS